MVRGRWNQRFYDLYHDRLRAMGIEEEARTRLLRTFCCEQLFPYVRETIDQLVIKGSFPALMLAPINFEALYQQTQAQQTAAPAAEETVQ